MSDRNIENIAHNWFALSEEEQDFRVLEWLQRNNIPAIAEELLNQMYEDDDDDTSDDSGSESDSDDADSAEDDSADGDTTEDDSDDENNADDDSDADSDLTLQEDIDVEIEDEPFDFFKFDYSYDRHNGPPYVEEEQIDYSIEYDAQEEPEYEEVIDR